jgi:histone deacetylase 11
MGTILAARESLRHGLAINLGGGFHHAKPAGGEGFCIYSDIGIAVASLRADGLLDVSSRVAYIDTDAHQGNGVCHEWHCSALARGVGHSLLGSCARSTARGCCMSL